MKKLILSVAVVCSGMLYSCVDKNEAVDADAKPEWLGSSIYEELANPNQSYLSGTFSYYLRLVDDLGYKATLSRTGSKTVFPANDEAFEQFFKNNSWGVTRYEQLSQAQKKQLLYTSMLDNAMLLTMLSNVTNGSADVARGMALKHETSVNVIDSVTTAVAGFPRTKYWDKYLKSGISYVSDATKPMLVHFTREQMVANNITTAGENSDFAILTGQPYSEGTAYVFDDQVLHGDVTCQNGYIHQMKDVLLPPGNMAQVLQKDPETSIFSHLLDKYSAPYFDQLTTNNYNDWAVANNQNRIDSIFQVRYFSAFSQGNNPLITDPNGNIISSYLSYDPGWNQYFPKHGQTSSLDYSITDMAAMFVPDDQAMRKYFLPGGNGAYLIDIYGSKKNIEENLLENLDSVYARKPEVITSHINNLMMTSFINSVPSKFTTLTNDASENMGMNMSFLKTKGEGKYDVKIANNGVIYVLNSMIAPDEYQSVMAPSSSYQDMKVMNWAVQDKDYLGVDFKYYLLAMSANYAFFIPDDAAFDAYYVDPTSLGHLDGKSYALHFYYDASYNKNKHLRCERFFYNPATGEIGQSAGEVKDITEVKSQLIDILNYHTVVLKAGETIADGNHYFKTKHGGEIYVSGGQSGSYVASGAMNNDKVAKSEITKVYTEKNGHAYRINHIIQAPTNSVYKTLADNSRFSEFLEACQGFDAPDLLKWAGISDEQNQFGTTEQDQYTVFTNNYGKVSQACLDYNVKFFNTYNYTLYAPDNAAMEKAYLAGLPRWNEIVSLFEEYGEDAPQSVKDMCKLKIKAIRDFVRYHFQGTSLYADRTVEAGNYKSLCSNDLGIAFELKVSGGNGKINLVDATGKTVDVNANGTELTNVMTRDYWFNAGKLSASAIATSSFCAVHEITEPLCFNQNGRYDGAWNSAAGAKAAKKWLARQRQIFK